MRNQPGNISAPNRSGALRTFCVCNSAQFLELVPEELVIDVVVILHFWRLHESSQEARTTVRGSLLQVSIASFHICAEQLGGPFGVAEVLQSIVDVIGQIPLG